mmetsp:Transcript_14023/g.38307  ORF Transcript_14023/g.38307 Transcript_14023/m.38307 type:complete len:116 (-) Transcript_14023:200-547(-)
MDCRGPSLPDAPGKEAARCAWKCAGLLGKNGPRNIGELSHALRPSSPTSQSPMPNNSARHRSPAQRAGRSSASGGKADGPTRPARALPCTRRARGEAVTTRAHAAWTFMRRLRSK